MKNKLLFLLTLFLITTVFLFNLKKNERARYQKKRIALFQPAEHPALERIKNSFALRLNELSGNCYEFDSFNAQANSTLARSQADTIIENNYEAMFAIGALCTELLITLRSKRNKLTPLFFGGVDKERATSLLEAHKQTASKNINGIVETFRSKDALVAFKQVDPKMQNILLIYNPIEGGGLEKEKTELINYAQTLFITIQTLAVANANEITEKIAFVLDTADAVLVLKDNTVVQAIELLLKKCVPKKIPLFVCDFESVKKGATAGYGFDEAQTGYKAAECAFAALQKNENFSTNAEHIDSYQLLINQKAAADNKIELNKSQLQKLIPVPVIFYE